jgi:ferrochelatase
MDAVGNTLQNDKTPQKIHFIERYHDHPAYITALANSVREHWQRAGRADKLIMSFHGIPEDYATAGGPYPQECHETANLLAINTSTSPA